MKSKRFICSAFNDEIWTQTIKMWSWALKLLDLFFCSRIRRSRIANLPCRFWKWARLILSLNFLSSTNGVFKDFFLIFYITPPHSQQCFLNWLWLLKNIFDKNKLANVFWNIFMNHSWIWIKFNINSTCQIH